jgi:hypothetical protein
MGKKPKIKLISINRYLKWGVFALLSCAICFLSYYLYFIEKNEKYIDQKYSVYTYNNSARVKYEVFLIPNKVFKQKSLGGGNIYIKDLIDHINTKFKYQFNGNLVGDIKGKYSVKAILEGFTSDEKGQRSLWKNEYLLQPEKSFNGKNSEVSIENQLPINIKDYIDFINVANTALKIGFNTRLTIQWNTSIEVKTDQGIVSEKLSPIMIIPMSEQTFQVAGNLVDEKSGSIEKTEKILSPKYKSKIKLFWIIDSLCAVLLLFILIFTISIPAISPLRKKINWIFKNHGDRMVVINSNISDISKEMIEVFSIDDLVRISDDIGRPIMYKKSSILEDMCNFYVIEDNNIYTVDIKKWLIETSTKENVSIEGLSM